MVVKGAALVNVSYAARLLLSRLGKVHIFWEGHKILRNLPLTFNYSTYSQKKVNISQNFIAFSEYMNFNYVLRVVSKCHNYLLGGLDFVISLWRSLTFLSPHAECGIRLQNPLLLLRYILSLRVQSYCSCSLAQHEFSRIFCPGFFIHCAKTSTLVTLWMNIQKITPFL